MIFRSDLVTAQWDTWCYFHAGTYYLYYLITESSGGEGFGVATSENGVEWKDHGWAIRASDKMVHFLGTGSVWPDLKNPGRFICNYSEHRIDDTGERRQCILFAWSYDLIEWTKWGDDHIFWIDERYYERYGRWDSINAIPSGDGGYVGTWTATPNGRENLNGGIGFGVSPDGLHWEAQAPAKILPDADESGDMVIRDGQVHAMFGHFGNELALGMHAYVAESVEGPFHIAEKSALLLRGWHTYYSRFFETPEGTLINHHAMNGEKNEPGRSRTYLSPFKKLEVDEEGVQRWRWWSGNERLKGGKVHAGDRVDFQQGIIAEGRLEFSSEGSGELRFEVDDRLYGIRVSKNTEVEFLSYEEIEDTWRSLQKADRCQPCGTPASFRLLARRGMAEFYLNDYFMECCELGCPESQTVRWLTDIADDSCPEQLPSVYAFAQLTTP